MNETKPYDVIVIGGGPAGLAAAITADKAGARVLLIEREARLGGILKQCIHDGFGLIHFGEKLSGPEYVERFEDEFHQRGIEESLLTFVTELKRTGKGFRLRAVSRRGILQIETSALILATGCRERTAKQVRIHGTRPAGILTAGTAQHFVNLQGKMPAKKCVVLGSGDIGLIMARRLTLEGAEVLGVYEVKPTPSGLTRNIVQCLEDYDIPLHLSHTVTRVFGEDRLHAVEVAKVDSQMQPIESTKEIIACDTLILSVGLIPENEIAGKLGVVLDNKTKGPVCDNIFMTSVSGVFSCGNALHVNDLVDYVTESGELAGSAAAKYAKSSAAKKTPTEIELRINDNLQYLVPQKLREGRELSDVVFYFRSRKEMDQALLVITVDQKPVFKKKYRNLKPPEMERLSLDCRRLGMCQNSIVEVAIMEEVDQT